MSDPYSTPKARVDDVPPPLDRSFNWKAALAGAAADLGASTVAGIILMFVYSFLLTQPDITSDQMLERLSSSWPFLMTSLIAGGACTVLGGHIAARMAGHSFYKHALAAGALSLVVGMLIFRPDDGPYSGLVQLIGLTMHLPLAALGGRLAWQYAVRP